MKLRLSMSPVLVARLLARTLAVTVVLAGPIVADDPLLDIHKTIFRGRTLNYEVIDGWAVHGGDILLGPIDQIEGDSASSGIPRPEATGIADAERLWPGGLIPFTVAPDLPAPERVSQAIEHWEERTPIRFVARSDQVDYVEFVPSELGCGSSIGRNGGRQFVSLTEDCGVGTVIHEIGHAVGLWHEQQRSDRDEYLTVDFDAALRTRAGAFSRIEASQTLNLKPYDYRSTMHYRPYPSARGLKPVFDSVPPGIPTGDLDGELVGLTATDADGVSRLYGIQPEEFVIDTNSPGLQIVVDGETYTAPQRFTWAQGSEHTIAVPSPQGDEVTRHLFANWSDKGAQTHTVTAGGEPTVFIANFIQQFRTPFLSRNPELGSVIVEPPSEDGFYRLNSLVTVTAEPAPGARFVRWEGRTWSDAHGSSANPVTAGITGPEIAYEAVFSRAPLTVISSAVTGFEVMIDGRPYHTPVAFDWAPQTVHRANVELIDQRVFRGYRRALFEGWADGGGANREITAGEFGGEYGLRLAQQDAVILFVSPSEAGSISTNPTLRPIMGRSPRDRRRDGLYVEAGQPLTLTATPSEGFEFVTWFSDLAGSENPAQGTPNPIDGLLSATAFFANAERIPVGEPLAVTVPQQPLPQFSYYFFDVPPDASNLEVVITGDPGAGPIQAHLRRGAPPRGTGSGILSDYTDLGFFGPNRFSVTPQSQPPLRQGPYFLALFANNHTFEDTDATVEVQIEGGSALPELRAATGALAFVTDMDGSPTSQVVELENAGSGEAGFSAATDAGWLKVTPPFGSVASEDRFHLTVEVADTHLAPGTYNAQVLIHGTDALSSPKNPMVNAAFPSIRIAITLIINAPGPAPAVAENAVVNAASFLAPIAPGSIATLFGTHLAPRSEGVGALPLPQELAAVRLWIDGRAASLFFVSPGQLNFQVPFETPAGGLVEISVENNLLRSPAVMVPVAEHAVGVFVDPKTGAPIILSESGGLVNGANPARGGEVLTIFATGLGNLTNEPASGHATPSEQLAATASEVRVRIGDLEATTLFAGLAPFFVGLSQINIELPLALPAGPTLPLVIQVAAAVSADVDLAVR